MELTEAQIAEITGRIARNKGSWNSIARELGTNYKRLRALCDPDFAEQEKLRKKQYYHDVRKAMQTKAVAKTSGGWAGTVPRTPRVPPEEAAAAIAAVPADTRDLTARAFGDPLPGRSALDRRLAAAKDTRFRKPQAAGKTEHQLAFLRDAIRATRDSDIRLRPSML